MGLLNRAEHELANREGNVVLWRWLFASRLQGKKPNRRQQPLRQFLRQLRRVGRPYPRTKSFILFPQVNADRQNQGIRQALQVLATQAGVTVIVDEQVSGTITALIENDPFDVALRKVLMPLGLVSRRIETGEYIVAAVDPSSPLFSKVSDRMEYRPTHVSPDELLKLLPQREARFVSVVDERNLMIVEAPTEIAEPILLRLREADNPIPQVELEAIVCVIAPDKGFKSGLDWNHAVTLNGAEVWNGRPGFQWSGIRAGG